MVRSLWRINRIGGDLSTHEARHASVVMLDFLFVPWGWERPGLWPVLTPFVSKASAFVVVNLPTRWKAVVGGVSLSWGRIGVFTGGPGRASSGAKPENKASLSGPLRLLFPQIVEGAGSLVFSGAFFSFSLCMSSQLWKSLAQLLVPADGAAPWKLTRWAVRGLPSAWGQLSPHIL